MSTFCNLFTKNSSFLQVSVFQTFVINSLLSHDVEKYASALEQEYYDVLVLSFTSSPSCSGSFPTQRVLEAALYDVQHALTVDTFPILTVINNCRIDLLHSRSTALAITVNSHPVDIT